MIPPSVNWEVGCAWVALVFPKMLPVAPKPPVVLVPAVEPKPLDKPDPNPPVVPVPPKRPPPVVAAGWADCD